MKIKKAISLYIHIPFCAMKCNYCDFLSFQGNNNTMNQYVQALYLEIESFSYIKEEYEVVSIFIGGGTPSILQPELITTIMDRIYDSFCLKADAEITIEMNPGTVTYDKLKQYKEAGINRLSIGLQSADENQLKILGRIHTYEEFLQNYQWARQLQFDNISIDIMQALPGQNLESYKKTLNKVIALKPDHISAYSLIIEEGTNFYDNDPIINQLPGEEEERQMYYETLTMLKQNGFDRYEISNYARSGFESKHNIVYWTGGEYLGLGLGASSYLNLARFSNTSDMAAYLKAPDCSISFKEDYTPITKKEQMEEFMFLGLRMMKGIDTLEFKSRFGKPIDTVYGLVVDKLIKQGLLAAKDHYLALTALGIDVSNQVLAEFLLDE